MHCFDFDFLDTGYTEYCENLIKSSRSSFGEREFFHLYIRIDLKCVNLPLKYSFVRVILNTERMFKEVLTMKRIVAVILAAACLFGLCGCDFSPAAERPNSASEQINLYTASGSDLIEFDGTHVEIGIYADEAYYFSSHNTAFLDTLTSFLKTVTFDTAQVDYAKSDVIYVNINDGHDMVSFSIHEADILCTENGKNYYSEGIYSAFEDTFSAFFDEYRTHCRSASTPILKQYEYAVYGKDGAVMESDSISRAPHLFYDNNTVHLWVQSGTGISTRYATFFDVKNERISPIYHGQTDYFGDTVCATKQSKIVLYDMFSGEQIGCIDRFEKPLADAIDNVCSAYFIHGGTQIQVEYLDPDHRVQTQIFDVSDID